VKTSQNAKVAKINVTYMTGSQCVGSET